MELQISGIYVSLHAHGLFVPSKGPDGDANAPPLAVGATIGYMVGGSVLYGLCCPFLSLAAVDIFSTHFNTSTPRSRFFADAAYCVYIIHPWVVTPLLWTWTQILPAAGGPAIVFPSNGSMTSSTNFGDDGLVVVGWLYACVVGQVIVWPLAWYVRKLPLLNRVL